MIETLIVDSRPAMRELLADYCSAKGMGWAAVVSWSAALLALEQAKLNGQKFGLVIVSREDVGKPLRYVVKEARLLDREVKFIISLTPPMDPERILEVERLGRGVAAYFEPVDARAFAELVSGLGLVAVTKVPTEDPLSPATHLLSSVPIGETIH